MDRARAYEENFAVGDDDDSWAVTDPRGVAGIASHMPKSYNAKGGMPG